MVDDILDTRFEGKAVDLADNLVYLNDDLNLMQVDPALRNVLIGAGWDVNAFNADTLDLDLSVFLLNKENMTRVDEDFVFYNQPETFDGGVKHMGDSRTGAGDGDDESILVDLHAVPFDIIHVAICVTIYKGYEKEQNLEMLRNAYVRIVNADTRHEICRFVIDQVLQDRTETGVIIGFLNREGPKWHFKPAADFVPGGLSELGKRFGLIINQE
ncbi:MAG: TerD family protein [Alphaproteobacteria bacterium]|nr:TerD family protein [Alphaproteobacteria bacterium]